MRVLPFGLSLSLSKGVHRVCSSGPLAAAGTGHEDLALSRQLADMCAELRPSGPGDSSSAHSRGLLGPHGELQKELPSALTGHRLYRGGSELR